MEERDHDVPRKPGVVRDRSTRQWQTRAGSEVNAMAAAPGDPEDFHGPVLASARLRLLYWGSAWHVHAALRGQIDRAAESILASSYVSALAEYRVEIGTGSRESSQVETSNEPSNDFDITAVQALLIKLFDGSRLPLPDDPQHLILVVAPPGVSVNGVLGQHDCFTYFSTVGPSFRVHYGWISGGDIEDYSRTLAHELVEAITDPELDAIHYGACADVDGTCEIADVCTDLYSLSDGTPVQAWYSRASHGCVRPGS